MSMADHAMDVEIHQRENAIEHARETSAQLDGPRRCVQCGMANDRSAAGFAVCSSCVAEGGMGGAHVR